MTEYQRFIPSNDLCPTCHKAAQEDVWPPNYGSSWSSFSIDGTGKSHSTYSASIKHVCIECHLQWTVNISRKDAEETRTIVNVRSMHERNGRWLTDHDLWRENYKLEHGNYPFEAYG